MTDDRASKIRRFFKAVELAGGRLGAGRMAAADLEAAPHAQPPGALA